MKKSMLSVGLSICVSATSWAATITDDFNRADQAFTNDTSLIGADWAQDSINDEWAISGGELHANSTAPAVMYNTGLETFSGNGSNFTLSTVVTSVTNGWTGVVFNYQDENNYYFLRFLTGNTAYHVLKKVDGAVSLLSGGAHTATETFATNVAYTINVFSRNAYDFWPNIRRGDTLVGVGHAVDGNHNFTGGHAGMFIEVNGLSAVYDDFSLEVNTSPSEVFDDFDRENTPMSGNSSFLGGYWMLSDGGAWSITNNSLLALNNVSPSVLYNNAFETISGNETNFTVSADVAGESSTWIGIAFNYQDSDNFYYLRIKLGAPNYHLLGRVGGIDELIDAGTISGVFAPETYYTLTIASDTPYDFDFTITEKGSSTVLNGTTNIVDGSGSLTGGYAGLYTSASYGKALRFDNFYLQGPPAETGYTGWAAGWGIDIGAESEDADEDGLINIYEYGLGGDPTNALDQGTSPAFAIVDAGGSNVFSYVHQQLSDPDSGLSYSLELNTDLAIGAWVNSGYMVVGTNVTGGDLNFVTNITDTVDGQKFIRLIIE